MRDKFKAAAKKLITGTTTDVGPGVYSDKERRIKRLEERVDKLEKKVEDLKSRMPYRHNFKCGPM